MALTGVIAIARNAALSASSFISESDAISLVSSCNTALDAVSNLTFSHIELQCKRDDDTPGS